MMNLNYLKELYSNSPMWLKKVYSAVPYDIRNGKEYRKWKNFLEKEIDEEAYQFIKLKETIEYAYKNTIYYKRVFDEIDFNIQDFKSLDDIKYLPLMDKQTVRDNYNEIIAKNYPKNRTFYVTTGGSSGEPMKFLQSKNIWAKELAFVNQYFYSYGYKSTHLKASFRGDSYNDKVWKINPIHNEIQFSPFHISSKTINLYIEQLNYLKPLFIHTYPSAIMLLIKNMKNSNLSLNYKLKAIFLTSENFTMEEFNLIKEYFDCEVSSFFGHTERLIFAPLKKESQTAYQIKKRYGFVELVADKENRLEITGSSFDNFAMPLIRYKTQDYTTYKEKNQLLNMIEGNREREFLYGRDEIKVPLTTLINSAVLTNTIGTQFYQLKTGKVKLFIIPKNSYTSKDTSDILAFLDNRVGHAIDFTIELISTPILTKRGKLQKLIKKLD